MAVFKTSAVVSHILYNIAQWFTEGRLKQGFCQVTGEMVNREAGYGLEVHCTFCLCGPKVYIDKIKDTLFIAALPDLQLYIMSYFIYCLFIVPHMHACIYTYNKRLHVILCMALACPFAEVICMAAGLKCEVVRFPEVIGNPYLRGRNVLIIMLVLFYSLILQVSITGGSTVYIVPKCSVMLY